jgi:hypothetical protein
LDTVTSICLPRSSKSLLPVPQEELCGPVIFSVVNFHHFAKKKKKKKNRKRIFCHKFLVLKEVVKKKENFEIAKNRQKSPQLPKI